MNGFEDLVILLRLLGDPAAYEARLKELRSTMTAADERTAESQIERDKLEAERSRLEALSADLRRREATVLVIARKNEQDVAAIEVWRRQQRQAGLVSHMGTLTSEPDTTVDAPDPIYSSEADTVASAVPMPAIVHRGRGRPRRVSA
jgi:chromosome segregation ATPase